MILIIDDDKAIQSSIRLLFLQAGRETLCASQPSDALEIIQNNTIEAILLDMNFGNETSGIEGLQFLDELKKKAPAIPVVLITAWASISLAVEGMKKGAFDFVSKPWDNATLLKTIETAIELNKKQKEPYSEKRNELDRQYEFQNIIGESPGLTEILETIGRIAKTDAAVLILGESGTGKELIAEAIHKNSPRKNEAFIKVNLGGISSSLFESELFGHKKGAFTDAIADRKGRFELADKGSIFLDEIGDLDIAAQVKLLRVLQDRTYQPLGDSKTRKTDVRVICATNRNIREMVQKGSFREDLFYRINLITLELPPLRERMGDIRLLVAYFLKNLKKLYHAGNVEVAPQTMEWLQEFTFPGNIRELKNLIERTWLMSGKNILEIPDFEKAQEQSIRKAATGDYPEPGSITLDELEKNMIIKTMEKFHGNISKVAKALGLSRGALYRRFEKYGIPYEQK